jgi:DNA-binding transcriptional LysR family regulator
MIALRVGAVRQVVCASPEFIAAHGTPATPGDLARFPCVTFGNAPARSWTFAAKRGSARAIPVRSRLVVNTAEAAIDAAIAGVGIVRVLSYQAAASVHARQLTIILQDAEPEPMPVHFLHPAQPLPPLKLRRFLDFAAPRLKKALAEIERRVV